MNAGREKFKAIRFGGELLPDWAQMLDVAARVCPVAEESRIWFSRFTAASGVDDSRTVLDHCNALRQGIQEHQELLLAELRRGPSDALPNRIIAAWRYSLETMIQEAQSHSTCSWTIEGTADTVTDDSDGGDISLRRV